MKTIALILTLCSGANLVTASNAFAAEKTSKKSDKKTSKKEKAPEVTYLDLSGPAEDENAMPAITPKGKL